MKKFLFCLVVAGFVLAAIPSDSEARCGRGGGRIRAWFKNRPHIFHRGGCN